MSGKEDNQILSDEEKAAKRQERIANLSGNNTPAPAGNEAVNPNDIRQLVVQRRQPPTTPVTVDAALGGFDRADDLVGANDTLLPPVAEQFPRPTSDDISTSPHATADALIGQDGLTFTDILGDQSDRRGVSDPRPHDDLQSPVQMTPNNTTDYDDDLFGEPLIPDDIVPFSPPDATPRQSIGQQVDHARAAQQAETADVLLGKALPPADEDDFVIQPYTEPHEPVQTNPQDAPAPHAVYSGNLPLSSYDSPPLPPFQEPNLPLPAIQTPTADEPRGQVPLTNELPPQVSQHDYPDLPPFPPLDGELPIRPTQTHTDITGAGESAQPHEDPALGKDANEEPGTDKKGILGRIRRRVGEKVSGLLPRRRNPHTPAVPLEASPDDVITPSAAALEKKQNADNGPERNGMPEDEQYTRDQLNTLGTELTAYFKEYDTDGHMREFAQDSLEVYSPDAKVTTFGYTHGRGVSLEFSVGKDRSGANLPEFYPYNGDKESFHVDEKGFMPDSEVFPLLILGRCLRLELINLEKNPDAQRETALRNQIKNYMALQGANATLDAYIGAHEDAFQDFLDNS